MKSSLGGVGRWILIGVIVLAVAAAIYAVVQRNGQPELKRTSVERVTQGEFVRDVSGSGTILAERERTLSFSNVGRVSDVFVSEGQTVEQGQALAKLDTASLERDLASNQASLDSARAELARIEAQQNVDRLDTDSSFVTAQDAVANAEASLADAQRTLDTTQRLFDAGAASQNELTTAQNTYNTTSRTLEQARLTLQTAQTRQGNFSQLTEAQRASASAQIAGLETTIANTQEQIDEATLTAPFAGTVTEIGFKAGDQIAQASTTGTLTLVDTSSLYASANFDENRALELEPGQAAVITPDADTRQELEATVRRVGTVATRSGTSGAAQIEAEFDFSESAVQSGVARPGYTITAKVTVNSLENVLLVPLEAVSEEDGQSFVYKVTESEPGQGVVEKVAVEVLDRNATLAATQSDALAANDLIAVINLEELQGGDNVAYDPLETESGDGS